MSKLVKAIGAQMKVIKKRDALKSSSHQGRPVSSSRNASLVPFCLLAFQIVKLSLLLIE